MGAIATLLPLLLASLAPLPGDERKPDDPPLSMSKGVVCKKIEGYEQFTPLPDASLTSDDKLNVYFRPLNYRVEPVKKPVPGQRYRASFSEDFRIRRKGEKTVLMKKDNVLDYDPKFDGRDYRIYMLNNIGLKGLPPGEYELDVVLHDLLAVDATATQSVAFTIIPTPKVDPSATKDEGAGEPEGPTAPVVESSPKKAKSKARPAAKPARPKS
jgi:hypothetical protein